MKNLLLSNELTQYFTNFDSAENIARGVCLWAIIAYIVAVIVCLFAVKGEKQRKVAKIVLSAVCAVLVVGIIATFLVFNGQEAKELNLLPLLYVPMIVFCVTLVASIIAIILKPNKIVKIVSGIALLLSIIAVIVCLSIYYESGASLELNWIEAENVNTLGLWLGAVGILVIIVLVAIFTDKEKGLDFDTKSLAYAGVLGGLSFALSYVRILKMPMGGSITLASMLPIMLYAYIFGTKKGIILGAVMGLLQAVQDPWILHPAQFMLDYMLAFACFGLSGCFAKLNIKYHNVKFLLGGITAGLLRFMSHFFSGAFAFGSFGLEEFNSIYLYSLVYNVSYVLPDALISIVVGVILFSSKSFTKIALEVKGVKKSNDSI